MDFAHVGIRIEAGNVKLIAADVGGRTEVLVMLWVK